MKRLPVAALASSRRAQRGAGALIVVLVLFFVISLVAAYSSRNMIFEQRTSANQYRSTQALEAADAGAAWALALLNAGSVDDNCAGSAGGQPFRTRYLSIDPTSGNIAATTWIDGSGAHQVFHEMCVLTDTGWSCSCPTSGEPALIAPTTSNPAPAFRLRLDGSGTGVIRITAQGCTSLVDTCLINNQPSTGDALSIISVTAALKGAVAAPPSAALTAGGAINFGGAAAQVTNTESRVNGLTIDAGQTINAAGLLLTTIPGAPVDNSRVANDSGIPTDPDVMFASVFGLSRDVYKQQPATIIRTCPSQCVASDLAALAAKNPGRILWLDGDVNLDSAVDIGSAAHPMVVVVNGNLTASAAARIFGLLYVYNASGTWTTAGSPTIQGAVVSEGGIGGSGTPNIVYDLGILTALRVSSGSFVRVPGGWTDI